MKKQLLIAAIAASMTSVAMADISISGAAKINYTTVDKDAADQNDTDTFKHEMDLKVAGKSGDTSITMNFGGMDNSGTDAVATFNMEDAYVKTSVQGVALKVGQWDNGNNALRASARKGGKFSASYAMSGVTVTYDAANSADESVKLAGSIAGVDVAYKQLQAGNDVSLKTTIAGVKMSYLALNRDASNTDRAVVEVSGTVGGVTLTAAKASTEAGDTIDGDTWMGDFEGASGSYALTDGQDVTSMMAKTSYLGNTVQLRHTSIDGKTGEDTTFTKVIVTRPLGNGTTFEATYTDLDDKDGTANDGATLDLELAVKF